MKIASAGSSFLIYIVAIFVLIAACSDTDSGEEIAWVPIQSEVLEARSDHTAIWTGNEMIVWGGSGYNLTCKTSGRYDPVSDAWIPVSHLNAPSPRFGHAAVWTGRKMIVWGGEDYSDMFDTGGLYDPLTNSWTSTNTDGAPTVRLYFTAVWTGQEMIVWGGGYYGGNFATGGRYEVSSDTWTPTSEVDAPSPRRGHSAVWTGSKMIIWGGAYSMNYNDGAMYDPVFDTWQATTVTNAPSPRLYHSAVWTGEKMIVWGGDGGVSCLNSGGIYDPSLDSWQDLPPLSLAGRSFHTAVWTGGKMIIWGGFSYDLNPSDLNDGAAYDLLHDSWTTISSTNAPSARADHTAVWTGSEMIVWGGVYSTGFPYTFKFFHDGGRYNPASDSWAKTSDIVAPSARYQHAGVWTGSEMLVWGGIARKAFVEAGYRYNPAVDAWTSMSLANAPVNRSEFGYVWTGSELIIFGGESSGTFWSNGGRYDPALDQWITLSDTGAPQKIELNAAVWTGSKMLMWGGQNGADFTFTNDGYAYDPQDDIWAAISTVNAPEGRIYHNLVWTGTEMIVWGGLAWDTSYINYNNGGRYDPLHDSWTLISTLNAPSPRGYSSAVWTGQEMIVWGGYDNVTHQIYSDGAKYDPAGDRWTPIANPGADWARARHSAVWTGRHMIIWGGSGTGPNSLFATGGIYDPAYNYWVPTPDQGAPSARIWSSAVWTGKAMIIFGGSGATSPPIPLSDGAQLVIP